MVGFKTILARAEQRKGGAEALARLLPPRPDPRAIARARRRPILAEMTKRVFSAGFAWSVIEAKWPGFEDAFLGFAPRRLAFEPDDFWDALTKDARIVRNGAKIMSVRANARFVREIGEGTRQFRRDARAMAIVRRNRPARFARQARLSPWRRTGQMLLRFLGWDGFATSKDVVACLRDAGLDIGEDVKSKRDLAAVQAQFNAWAAETGLPYAHLSRICAMSIGENYEPSRLASIANAES